MHRKFLCQPQSIGISAVAFHANRIGLIQSQKQLAYPAKETVMNSPLAKVRQTHPETTTDVIALTQALAMNATLDHSAPLADGDALPYLWHWIYFRPCNPQSAIGEDGHPRKGGFLPDLGLPRRMWAGGRLRFKAALPIGASATRTSQVLAVEEKSGRSGRLAFVTVKHEIVSGGAMAIEEEQDIVYRAPAAPGTSSPGPQPAPLGNQWQREITPTEVLLFRYSALTFNSHRIHYDKPYATEVEGYPELVVHGPLIATLLMDLASTHLPGIAVLEYSFKAIRPTFLGSAFTICGQLSEDGQAVDLWAKDHEGWLTMSARAVLA
jgi:3-methylfumaryl-CoA hydratase